VSNLKEIGMSKAARNAAEAKQDAYNDVTRQTARARRLDAVGARKLADKARLDAADAAQMAVRMETCPKVPR